MSRPGNSKSFNGSLYEDKFDIRSGNTKPYMNFGSKKTRNQANCSQYFVKSEQIKNKVSSRGNGSQRSSNQISNKAQLFSSTDRTFHMKIQRQMEGKLKDVVDRDPSWMQYRNKSTADIRIVDDDRTRNSLATLASSIDYAPKLKKTSTVGFPQNVNHDQKKIQKKEPKTLEKTRSNYSYYGFGNESFEEPKIFVKKDHVVKERPIEEKEEEPRRNEASPKQHQDNIQNDLNSYYQKRNPLRKAKGQESTSTQLSLENNQPKWDYIEEIEKKIQIAINKSRSRGGSIQQDLSNSRHGESVRPREEGYNSLGIPITSNQTRQNEHNRYDNFDEGTSQEWNKRKNQSIPINTDQKNHERNAVGSHTLKSSNNQDNSVLNNRYSDIQKEQSGTYTVYKGENQSRHSNKTDYQSGEASQVRPKIQTKPNDEMSSQIRIREGYNYDQSDTKETKIPTNHHSKEITINEATPEKRGAPFNSFRNSDLPTPNLQNSTEDPESPDYRRWINNPTFIGQNENRNRQQALGMNMSQISGISPIANLDRSAFVDMSTPSLIQGERRVMTVPDNDNNNYEAYMKNIKLGNRYEKKDNGSELNSNFLRRIWNLRFVASQELKILVADSVIFVGDKKNGIKCGKGKFITQKGGRVLYEGYFYDNLYHGNGKLWNPKHSKVERKDWFTNLDEIECWESYEGHFSGGYPEGFGKLMMNNGEEINGLFLRGRLNGQATVRFSNQDALKGEWQDNILIDNTTNQH